jgi:small GTP-binding protein
MPDKPATNQIPPGLKLRHTLRGHENIIYRIAWSPDGRVLASGSSDHTIRLWDTGTGKLRRILAGRSGEIFSVAWSPDGLTLVSSSNDKTVRFWDVVTGQLIRKHKVGSAKILCVAWSPDGRRLALGGSDGIVRMWDFAATGQFSCNLEGHQGDVNSVAWSPDGRVLAAGGFGGTIKLWDAKTGQLHHTLKRHSSEVFSVAWLPDGRMLASGSDDSTIRLWDAATGQIAFILEGHMNAVSSISISFNGHLLASKSADGTVRFWRCDNLKTIAVLDESASFFWPPSLAFHPKATVLATLGEDDTVIRIWDLDFEAILGATSKEKSVFYTTAKIALVGDSGVGKTGLGWRMAHGEFKEHPSTHGQQFWVIDELGATRKDETQCEAVLWDLAGQPDYRLVHALFLDDVDLALVLFDPTNRQEPMKGVEYWLKQLARERRGGRRRRVILVGARADRGTPTLTREELEEFCRGRGVEVYLSTSAATGEGIEELLERVRASIFWDEMPATVTTTTFKRVKEFVLKLKEDGGRKGVLVSPAELRARLEETDAAWEFTDAEMMTAVRHLANHGYVAVPRGSSGEETVLLAPDLLVNLASSFVLEARRNPKGLGALDEARVLRGEYQFPDLAGLDARERDVLLDAATVLFLEHNLCFRETLGEQTFLIFPALINQKRPQFEDIEKVDDYSYRVRGAVENVYAALVVLLGYTSTFARTNQWQNQAEYETAQGDVCGFRQTEEREGEIELVLYHAEGKAGARLLFQGLFEAFMRGRGVDVTKFPPVACPKCDYRQPRVEVVKRIGEGKGFLFCSQCGKKIALPKAGEEVALSSSERATLSEDEARTRRKTAFEAALVRVKAVVRDERKSAPSCFVSYAWGDPEHERWVRELASDLQNAGIGVILDQRDNSALGGSVARFISGGIERSDFVVVIGTPLYKQKYENKVSTAGSVVAAEVDLIDLRLTGTEEEKETVLPLLAEGDPRASLPPLMRGRVRGDFLQEGLYFASLFDLVPTLYRIPFEHAAVSDLRESLRGGAEWPR